MAVAHLDRLSATDASFLTQENASAHMHIGAVLVFEGPPPSYDEFAEHVEARLVGPVQVLEHEHRRPSQRLEHGERDRARVRPRRDKLGDRGAFEMHRWLRAQLASNRPYDQWVRELLTASGSSARIGPVNFYRASATPEELARSVSQAFLGVRLECAQCHHHPFEKWGQEDFYALAGFFNAIERKKTGDDEVIVHPGYRAMALPMTNRVVPARPPATPQQAKEFLATVNQTMLKLGVESAQASWVYSTFITQDTEALNARAIWRICSLMSLWRVPAANASRSARNAISTCGEAMGSRERACTISRR